jgi:hypothetical protein
MNATRVLTKEIDDVSFFIALLKIMIMQELKINLFIKDIQLATM